MKTNTKLLLWTTGTSFLTSLSLGTLNIRVAGFAFTHDLVNAVLFSVASIIIQMLVSRLALTLVGRTNKLSRLTNFLTVMTAGTMILLAIHFLETDSEMTIEGSHLMVAAGRIPNTKNIGLELAGIEITSNGYIKVNDRLETTASGVWAAGECAGSPHFTHISENDFHVIVDNILGGNRVTTGRQVPFCMFTDPEFARIGLSEKEAQEQGISYRLAKIPFGAILRARTISETQGFMKTLIDTKSDRILGFSAFGVDAGGLMAPVQVVMLAGLPFTLLRDMIFPHPTMAEGLNSLFSEVPAS